MPRRTAVTGVTHLVTMSEESIFEGNEFKELEGGDIVEVDTDIQYLSRRGPNQEIYRERDRQGPQDKTWYGVLSVNREKVPKGVFIREGTFSPVEDKDQDANLPWLLFGTDGKNEDHLVSAVKAGYRRFDCAESYGNVRTVAAVLNRSGLKRSAYEIVYKFDVRNGEPKAKLRERLGAVFSMFAGLIDSLLIHNLEGMDVDLQNAWQLMNQLKQAGSVAEVGLGNVRSTHAHLISELEASGKVEVVENSARSVLSDPDTLKLLQKLGVKVYYYDVVKTADEIGLKDRAEIESLVYAMGEMARLKSHAIMSSGNEKRQKENLENFGEGEGADEFEGYLNSVALEKIDRWKLSETSCLKSDEAFKLPGNVRESLEFLLAKKEAARKEILLGGHNYFSKLAMEKWLLSNTNLQASDLNIGVPARKGMKKYYVGMPLSTVLASLLGPRNCDWKWAIELISAMLASAEDWDSFGHTGVQEIV